MQINFTVQDKNTNLLIFQQASFFDIIIQVTLSFKAG